MANIIIPYVVADFIEIRERGLYYVDKTQYVARLEDYRTPVFLRPRRFGESLLVFILACYYDRTKAHRFEELFDDTQIGNHSIKEHNRYIIIRYDFSAMVMSDHIQELAQNLNDLNCDPVEVMVAHNRDLFSDFEFSNRGDASKILEEVLTYARPHELPRVYILIDEYDSFTNQLLTARNDPLYEEVTTNNSFLRAFFKVIKRGIGGGSICTCFHTGVLPVTMDDLTDGYSIAEILTLEPNFLNMSGFTYGETETYLRHVPDKYSTGQDRFGEIWQLVVSNCDGYRFRPSGGRLFNAIILAYFFKKFTANAGSIPDELVDGNLHADIRWVRRLALSLDNTKTMLDTLVTDNELLYNVADFASRFSKKKLFDKEFYPISLLYLGVTTLKDKLVTTLPNMMIRGVYMDYYNQLNKIRDNAQRYIPVHRHCDSNRSSEPLIRDYFEQYLGQFPAQVFGRINENFIRCSFYELVSRYLSSCYTFAIEQNNSVGRSNFEMTSIPSTDYYAGDRVVEFRYYHMKETERMFALSKPLPEHVEQVRRYGENTKKKFPNYGVRIYVMYICANKGWKCWEVWDNRICDIALTVYEK